MGTSGLRRLCRQWSARRWCALALLAAALLLARRAARPPADLVSTVSFPHAQPAAVAHLLADFSTHPSPFSIPVSWSIEKEASNYTSWRYSVSYECGERCVGAAEVQAHDEGRPRHGRAARAHRVIVRNTFCVTLSLLPWPQFCGELKTISVVRADEMSGGALLEELASARCGWLGSVLVLGERCGLARLRALRDQHLQYVRRALENNH